MKKANGKFIASDGNSFSTYGECRSHEVTVYSDVEDRCRLREFRIDGNSSAPIDCALYRVYNDGDLTVLVNAHKECYESVNTYFNRPSFPTNIVIMYMASGKVHILSDN